MWITFCWLSDLILETLWSNAHLFLKVRSGYDFPYKHGWCRSSHSHIGGQLSFQLFKDPLSHLSLSLILGGSSIGSKKFPTRSLFNVQGVREEGRRLNPRLPNCWLRIQLGLVLGESIIVHQSGTNFYWELERGNWSLVGNPVCTSGLNTFSGLRPYLRILLRGF